MLVDVYPLKRLPRSLGPFTYRVPKELSARPETLIGQWVRVPFRGRSVDGVLWNRRDSSPEGVTQIEAVQELLPVPPVTHEQRAIAEYLSHEGCVSLSLALWAMFPERARREPKRMSARQTHVDQRYTVTAERQKAIAAAVASEKNETSPAFLPLGTVAERLSFLLLEIGRMKPGQQTLIVAPTVVECERLSSILSARFAGRVCTLSSELPRTVFWQSWMAAAEKKNGIFVTTKIGLFAPYAALGMVVLDLESDPSHKQNDQNPRYHAGTMLQKLAALHHARCYLLDAQPSLATWTDSHIRKLPFLPRHQTRRIVALAPKMLAAALVSTESETAVQQTTGSILVFLNRKGSTRTLVCRDCGWQFRCPSCSIPLNGERESPSPCQHCGTAVSVPQLCPSCHGTRLVGKGIGVERLSHILQTLAPNRRIVTIEGPNNPEIRTGDIVVATEKILHLSHVPPFGLVIFAHTDGLIGYPDFSSVERGYLLAERVCALAASNAEILLQTFDPEQPMLAAIRTQQPDTFYQKEIALRQQLLLPPAHRVIALFGYGASAAETASLVDRLTRESAGQYAIDAPRTPDHAVRQRDRQIVLIRLLSGSTPPVTLRTVLAALPDGWLVDPQPESFLS